MATQNHSEDDDEAEWIQDPSADDVDSRLDDLESRQDDLESASGGGYGGVSAGYSLGATLAMILSWQSNHAVIWALLHGLLSWLYVIYYLVINWQAVKLI
jgi:hypothetical protein